MSGIKERSSNPKMATWKDLWIVSTIVDKISDLDTPAQNSLSKPSSAAPTEVENVSISDGGMIIELR